MHKYMNIGFCLAAAFTGLTALFTVSSAIAQADGAKIFADSCASCHPKGGNILDAKKPVTGSKILASKKALKDYLLKKNGAMPAFPKIANEDADLGALYDYCKSLK
jgi:mono/diheme cytochrome c family protein